MRPRIMALNILVVVALVAGCSPKATPTPKKVVPTSAPRPATPRPTPTRGPAPAPAASGGELIVGHQSEIVYLDPSVWRNWDERMIAGAVYEGLVRYSAADNEVELALAQSYEVSDDGLEWTFELQEGVCFHDGISFDARVAEWNFRRWMDPTHSYHTGNPFWWRSAFGGDIGEEKCVVESVTVVDDYTLKVVLRRPFPSLLQTLADPPFAFVSPASVEQAGDDFGKTKEFTIGTGPFVLVDWWPGEGFLRLVRNTSYWGESPAIDVVTFKWIREHDGRLAALRAGQIDVAFGLSQELVLEAEDDEDLCVMSVPGSGVVYLGMNQVFHPLDGADFRRAIVHAVDRHGIVRALYGDDCWVADQLLPPSFHLYDEDASPYSFDPDFVAELLAKTQYSQGTTLTLFYTSPMFGVPDAQHLAEVVAGRLTEQGIRVHARLQGRDAFRALVRDGHAELYLDIAGNIRGDADSMLANLFGGRWPMLAPDLPSEDLFGEIDAAARTINPQARADLYHKANEIIRDEALILPIAHPPLTAVLRKHVDGLVLSPFRTAFESVSFAPQVSSDVPVLITGPDLAAVGEPVGLQFDTIEGLREVCEVEAEECPEDKVHIRCVMTDSPSRVYVDQERMTVLGMDEGPVRVWAEYEYDGQVKTTPAHEVELAWIPTGAVTFGVLDEDWPDVPVPVVGGATLVFDVLPELVAREVDPEVMDLKFNWRFGDGTEVTTFSNGTRIITRLNGEKCEVECEWEPPFEYEECHPLPPYMILHSFPENSDEEYEVSVTVEGLSSASVKVACSRPLALNSVDNAEVKFLKHIKALPLGKLLDTMDRAIKKMGGKKLSPKQRKRIEKLAADYAKASVTGDKEGERAAWQKILDILVSTVGVKNPLISLALQGLSAIVDALKKQPLRFDVKQSTPENGWIDGNIAKNTHYRYNDKPLTIRDIDGGVIISIGYNSDDILVKDNSGTLEVTTNAGTITVAPRNDEDIKIHTNLGKIVINAYENNDLIHINKNLGTIKLTKHDDDLIVEENTRLGQIEIVNYDEVKIGRNIGGKITIQENYDDIVINFNGVGNPWKDLSKWGTIEIERNDDFIDINDNGLSWPGKKCVWHRGGRVVVWANDDHIEIAPWKGGYIIYKRAPRYKIKCR